MERITKNDSENARTYYHYACDRLGSITYVIAGNEFGNGETDGDINSRILCRYEYDAFGNTINAEENITNRYGFTGEMHDDITDMYYLRARYYAPCMGRFTQADTYHGNGLNLYVYAGNNPVKYVDPSGHSCKNNNVNSGLKEFDILPYGKFKDYPGYDLTGHELLQNAWLEAGFPNPDLELRGIYAFVKCLFSPKVLPVSSSP